MKIGASQVNKEWHAQVPSKPNRYLFVVLRRFYMAFLFGNDGAAFLNTRSLYY